MARRGGGRACRTTWRPTIACATETDLIGQRERYSGRRRGAPGVDVRCREHDVGFARGQAACLQCGLWRERPDARERRIRDVLACRGHQDRLRGRGRHRRRALRGHPATCYGYADKNWGADFTSPWVWLASSNLTSNLTGKRLGNSAFEIGGGRPKAFGIALERKLLGQLVYKGKPYEFNFSKPWTGARRSSTARNR